MFGAGDFLNRERYLDKTKAALILIEWLNNYDGIARELGIDI